MAYVSKELKAKIAPNVKAILKKYNLKGSLSVNNHSSLVLTVRAGALDIIGNFNETQLIGQDPWVLRRRGPAVGSIQVNKYSIDDCYTGVTQKALNELSDAMHEGNWDKSDSQSDYFDVGWYVNINVGNWNKPYVFTK